MKTLLASVVSLLFIVISFSPAQDPVPLETWYSIKSYPDFQRNYGVFEEFSVIPRFGKEGTKYPIIIGYRSFRDSIYRVETWFNRTKDDTINRFTWGQNYTFPPTGIISLDINGDGHDDFLNSKGRLYMGTKNDVPDTSKYYQLPSRTYYRYAGSAKNTFGDYNTDGKDDVLYLHEAGVNSPNLMTIIFGGEDVGALQRVSAQSPAVMEDTTLNEQAAVLYQNKQGAWRLLSYVYGYQYKEVNHQMKLLPDPFKAALRLYSVRFDGTKITLEKIDEYRAPEWKDFRYVDIARQPFEKGQTFLFQSKNFPKILAYSLFIDITANGGVSAHAATLNVTDDRIVVSNNYVQDSGILSEGVLLEHSVDGDSTEDIALMSGDVVEIYSFLPGNMSPVRRYRYHLDSPGTAADVYSIGDINGDGISDVTAIFRNDFRGNTFVIFKGKDWQTVSVSEPDMPTLTVSIEPPYPLPETNGMLAIPITVSHHGVYSLALYDDAGRIAQKVFDGALTGGKHILQFGTGNLANGMYSLRLSGGASSADFPIIIAK